MIRRAAIIFTVLIGTSSCGQDCRYMTDEDSQWIRNYDPINYAVGYGSELDASSFGVVVASHLVETIEQLENTAIKEISADDAQALAPSLTSAGKYYYLVRSCYFSNNPINHFYLDKRVLLHANTNFSEQCPSMKKSAIVIMLDQKPSDYLFNCGLAK